ncbi:tRNA (5-methylaminomethyl-2-thiouridine)(34)-methyltransferase MnmD [Sunxiuqinia sp. A32]|uniref:tRNA (5-methylaminomethyl-2-thiouridine)(34)-methyltransferase MnmD n=1 Tax=Sunxiuqinia sp. A32 TaxID=3461496 RepID=UPI0040466F96
MERKIQLTEDGSHTLYLPQMEEHFHSTHGAVQESMHVFINNGLMKTEQNPLTIFEVGFGTGLNAFLTLIQQGNREVRYYSIEKYPLSEEEYLMLNYPKMISKNDVDVFLKMHRCPWNQLCGITPNFHLHKIQGDLQHIQLTDFPEFDLIYFDAFAPGKQPEMWTHDILDKVSNHTKKGGVFATYTAKGEVRRTLISNGFNMKRVPGPPGKKEILFGEKA